jgi:hypothetical protein
MVWEMIKDGMNIRNVAKKQNNVLLSFIFILALWKYV